MIERYMLFYRMEGALVPVMSPKPLVRLFSFSLSEILISSSLPFKQDFLIKSKLQYLLSIECPNYIIEKTVLKYA